MSVPTSGAMDPEARLAWLRRRLAEVGTVTIAEATIALGASGMTVRRDLATLEALGEARRVRGGAHALGPSPFRSRSPRNAKAKIAIAEKLVSMVPSSGAIAIDSSSTMACLAHVLTSARDLLVVTNGLEVFESLQGRPGVRVVLTGGERDVRTSSLVGPTAEAAARCFRYDVTFVSAAAVDTGLGALEATPEEAAMVGAFVANAERVVLGADTSKIGTFAPVLAVEWDRVDVFVTETTPHDARLDPLRGSVDIV